MPIPQLALIAATRGMLGAGIGLLLGGKLSPDVRKAVGATLVAVGVVTTIPLALQVFGASKETVEGKEMSVCPESSWEEREARRSAAAA
jgi:hypothetical protein